MDVKFSQSELEQVAQIREHVRQATVDWWSIAVEDGVTTLLLHWCTRTPPRGHGIRLDHGSGRWVEALDFATVGLVLARHRAEQERRANSVVLDMSERSHTE